MNDQSTRRKKAAALYLLRQGVLTAGEIAHELKLNRQTVRYWGRQAVDFDYREVRKAYVRRKIEEALQSQRGDDNAASQNG